MGIPYISYPTTAEADVLRRERARSCLLLKIRGSQIFLTGDDDGTFYVHAVRSSSVTTELGACMHFTYVESVLEGFDMQGPVPSPILLDGTRPTCATTELFQCMHSS